jgi:hypothetical protein
MVSTDVDDRAMLCLAGHQDVARPPCAGVPVTNWDWDEVQGISEESGEGWGRFHVVGTFDGEAFTLTERPEAPREAESTPGDLGFTSPCPEPPGGWPIPDPDRVSRRALETAGRTAEHQRDYAGHWIDYIGHGPRAGYTGRVIIVIAFAGDPQVHEARIRRVWGGALCLTHHRYTLRKLSRIQEQVHGPVGEEMSLWPQASWVDTMHNVARSKWWSRMSGTRSCSMRDTEMAPSSWSRCSPRSTVRDPRIRAISSVDPLLDPVGLRSASKPNPMRNRFDLMSREQAPELPGRRLVKQYPHRGRR